jgi:hypothetical protein
MTTKLYVNDPESEDVQIEESRVHPLRKFDDGTIAKRSHHEKPEKNYDRRDRVEQMRLLEACDVCA